MLVIKAFLAFSAFVGTSVLAQSNTSSAPAATPSYAVKTATITFHASVYKTTYSSYDGSICTSFLSADRFSTDIHSAPTPNSRPVDHKVVVGGDAGNVFNPTNITAAVRDTVTFEFHPKNHSVSESTFNQPCVPVPNGVSSGLYVISPPLWPF
jgi:plastocyanin